MNKNTLVIYVLILTTSLSFLSWLSFGYQYTFIDRKIVKISAVMYQEPCPDCNCYMECDASFSTPEVEPNRYCPNCKDWK